MTKRDSKILITVLMLIFIVLSSGILICRGIFPKAYQGIIEKNCAQFAVDKNLVEAIIHTESGFDERATSSSGAVGLMQLLPSTGKWCYEELGYTDWDTQKLYNAEVNIELGVYYYKYLLEKFGSEELAIVAYNCGEGNLSNWLVDSRYSSNGALLRIPFTETRNYVKKVGLAKGVYNFFN